MINEFWELNQQNRITFVLVDAAYTEVTGLTNTFVLEVSKNAGAFVGSAGTKAEISDGWYTYLATVGEADTQKEFSVGTELPVKALVGLGSLTSQDVQVEIFYGLVDSNQNLYDSRVMVITPGNVTKSGRVNFSGAISCQATGNFGFTIRVLPSHPDLVQPFETNLITWGE